MADEKVDNKDKKETPTGNDPTPPAKGEPKAFNPTTLADEDFDKIFEDPRLWKHERFKKLNDEAKKARDLEAAEEERKTKELESQKKYQDLADKYKVERDEARKRFQERVIDNQITLAASKAGVVDLEAALKLVDRNAIKVGEDGAITGADEAIKSLVESKPYLKSATPPVNIGSPTNPSNAATGVKKFTLSQIQDPKFYQEHRDEIAQAYKTQGGIIDDTQGGQQ